MQEFKKSKYFIVNSNEINVDLAIKRVIQQRSVPVSNKLKHKFKSL